MKPNPGRIAYTNARLLDPATGLDAPGGLLTEGEQILDFGAGLFRDGTPDGATVIDCGGACLAPGLIDMRVQLREPGEEHKETLKSGGRAAVAGGVTTMVCLPNTTPVIDEVATLEYVARRARLVGLAKVYPFAALTKGLAGTDMVELGLLAEAGALAFTDGPKACADVRVLRRVMQYAATLGLLIVQHPEEPGLAGGVMNAGELSTRLGLPGIPRDSEAMLLERDLRLVRMTGVRYHAAHMSTAEGLDLIRRAKDRGLPVTAETAPPYFALNEMAIGDYRTFAKLSPPLRAEDDRQAVVQAIKEGVIDAIASDHAPQDQDSKRQPFGQAAFGGIGLETLLPVSLELYHNQHLGLLDVLRLLTSGPATLLGLGNAGRLIKGGPADLVLFDPETAWKVVADTMQSKSKNSPFDGRPVMGRVLRTVVDGRTVFTHDS